MCGGGSRVRGVGYLEELQRRLANGSRVVGVDAGGRGDDERARGVVEIGQERPVVHAVFDSFE